MRPINLVFFAVCLVIASADTKFGLSSIESRIIGGEDAEEGQFPYQVSLRHSNNGKILCGGGIISNRFILTAAHCAEGQSPSTIYAVAGALHLDQGGVKLDLDKVTYHEKWNSAGTLNSDVALLRTTEEIQFTETIQPIALPTRDLQADETPVLLAGWGRTDTTVRPFLRISNY